MREMLKEIATRTKVYILYRGHSYICVYADMYISVLFQGDNGKTVLNAKDFLDSGTPIVLKITINEENVSIFMHMYIRICMYDIVHVHLALYSNLL